MNDSIQYEIVILTSDSHYAHRDLFVPLASSLGYEPNWIIVSKEAELEELMNSKQNPRVFLVDSFFPKVENGADKVAKMIRDKYPTVLIVCISYVPSSRPFLYDMVVEQGGRNQEDHFLKMIVKIAEKIIKTA